MSLKWDEIYQKKGEYFKDIHDRIIPFEKLCKEKGVHRLLDFCCGTGRHTLYFAGKGYEVHGFDISPTGLKMAEEKLRKFGLKAKLWQQNMSDPLPYPDNYFDAVLAVRALSHGKITKLQKILNEIHRVTKQGGLLISDVVSLQRTLRLIKGGEKFEQIEERTYIPLEGQEKGLPHHNFIESEAREYFFSKLYNEIEFIDTKEHFEIIAEKK